MTPVDKAPVMNPSITKDDRVKVLGSATYDDIDAQHVRVLGSLTVKGDTHAKRAKVAGAATIRGNLDVDSITVSGSTKVAEDVTADSVSVSGSLSVRGTTQADTLDCSGSVKLETVTADQFETSGMAKVATLEAETVWVHGAIQAGHVEADDVRFNLVGESVVSSLVGDSIVVGRRRPDGFLRAKSIEGSDIALDYVDVERVVGDHVKLGANARIGVVEAEELDMADGAVVDSAE